MQRQAEPTKAWPPEIVFPRALLSGNLGSRAREMAPASGSVCERLGEWRTDVLVVARESAMDTRLLENMITSAHVKLARLIPKDKADAIRETGIKPFDEPASFGGLAFEEPNLRAVLFELEGAWFLYALGSASKSDKDSINSFSDLLSTVVREIQPKRIVSPSFSRLVRNTRHGANLREAIWAFTDLLDSDVLIDVGQESSKTQWDLMASFADTDRSNIRGRTQRAVVLRVADGEWCRDPRTIPFGTRIEGKRLVWDYRLVSLFEEVIEVLASDLPRIEMARRLDSIGLLTPWVTGYNGWAGPKPGGGDWDDVADRDLRFALRRAEDLDRSIMRMGDPSAVVRRLHRDLSLYSTGRLVRFLQLDPETGRVFLDREILLPGRQVAEGLTPAREAPYVELVLDLGPPPTPWAAEHKIEAAMARQREFASASRGGPRQNCLPLTRSSSWWQDECGDFYVVAGSPRDSYSYDLVRATKASGEWRLQNGQAPVSRSHQDDQTVVAHIPPAAFHDFVAETTLAHLEAGVVLAAEKAIIPLLEGAEMHWAGRAESRLSQLEAELRGATRDAQIAKGMATSTWRTIEIRRLDGESPSDETGIERDRAAEDAMAKVAALQLAVEGARQAASPRPPTKRREIEFRARPVIFALRALAEAKGSVPSRVAQGIGRYISDLRVTAHPDALDVQWTIHLPTDDSLLSIPISSQMLRLDMEGRGSDERFVRILDENLLAGVPVSEIRGADGMSRKHLSKNLTRILVDHGLPQRNVLPLLTHPSQTTRSAVWRRLKNGSPRPDSVSSFDDWIYCQFLTDESFTDRTRPGPWMLNGSRAVHAVLRALDAIGPIPVCRLLREARAMHPEVELRSGKDYALRMIAPLTSRVDCGQEVCPECGSTGLEHVVHLRGCPHQGCTGVLSIRVGAPDCPGELICGTCMRAPSNGVVRFPEEYRAFDPTYVAARQAVLFNIARGSSPG